MLKKGVTATINLTWRRDHNKIKHSDTQNIISAFDYILNFKMIFANGCLVIVYG